MFKNIYQSVLLRKKDALQKKREDNEERSRKFKFNFKFDARKFGGFLLKKPSLHFSQGKEKNARKEDCFMKRPYSSSLPCNNNSANNSEIREDDFCELMDGNKDVVMAVKLPKSFNILDDNVDIQIELELLCGSKNNSYNNGIMIKREELTADDDDDDGIMNEERGEDECGNDEDYEEDEEDCGFTQLRKVDENKFETVYYGTIKVPPNTSFSKLSNMPLYFFDANEELVDDKIQSKRKKPQVVIKPTTSSSNCHNQNEIDVNEIEITYLNLTVKFIKKSNIKGLRMLPNFLEYRFLTNNEEQEREEEQQRYENEEKEVQKTTKNKEERTIVKIQTQQEENKFSTKSNEKIINIENSDDKDKNDCNYEEEEEEEEIATIYCSCSSKEEITKTMAIAKNTNINNGLEINIPIENSYSHLNTGIREKEREVEMENIVIDVEKRNTNKIQQKISENNEKNETKTSFFNSSQEWWENENVKYSSIAKEVIEEIINTKLTSSSSVAIEKNTNKDELKTKNNVENGNNKKEQEEQLKSMQLEAYEAILRKRYGRNHSANVKKDVDGCCCCDLKKLTYAVVESDVKSMIKDLLAESNNIKEAVIINNNNNAAFIDGKEEVKESLDDEFVLLEEEEIKLLMQQQTKQQRKHEEVEGEENYDNKASSSNKNFVVKLIEDFIIKELKLNNKKLATTTNSKENQSSKDNKLSKKEQEEDKTTGEDGKTAAYFCLNNANNQKIAEPKILKTSYIFGGQQKGCEERNERLPTISLKRSSPPRKSLQIKSQTQNKEQETLTNILKNSTHLLNNIYQELCMFDRMSTNNQSTIDIEVQEKLIKSKIPPYAHAYNELNLNSYFDASLPTNRQTKDET